MWGMMKSNIQYQLASLFALCLLLVIFMFSLIGYTNGYVIETKPFIYISESDYDYLQNLFIKYYPEEYAAELEIRSLHPKTKGYVILAVSDIEHSDRSKTHVEFNFNDTKNYNSLIHSHPNGVDELSEQDLINFDYFWFSCVDVLTKIEC